MIAGTIVIANEPPPGNSPVPSPIPSSSSERAKITYSSTMNATIRHATSRGAIPERRSAHAVSAMPPAPAAANRRVATRPAIVIS